MPDNVEAVRQLLGLNLTDADAEALLASYQALSRTVSAFPHDKLRELEPALRSIPAPRRQ